MSQPGDEQFSAGGISGQWSSVNATESAQDSDERLTAFLSDLTAVITKHNPRFKLTASNRGWNIADTESKLPMTREQAAALVLSSIESGRLSAHRECEAKWPLQNTLPLSTDIEYYPLSLSSGDANGYLKFLCPSIPDQSEAFKQWAADSLRSLEYFCIKVTGVESAREVHFSLDSDTLKRGNMRQETDFYPSRYTARMGLPDSNSLAGIVKDVETELSKSRGRGPSKDACKSKDGSWRSLGKVFQAFK